MLKVSNSCCGLYTIRTSIRRRQANPRSPGPWLIPTAFLGARTEVTKTQNGLENGLANGLAYAGLGVDF